MTELFATVPERDLGPLADALAARAAERSLLDVTYRTLDTRLGALLVAATPRGLVSITFDGGHPDATLERLAGQLGPRILHDDRSLDGAARGLEALVEGRARRYEGSIDLTLAQGFRGEVVRALRQIPYGQTRSYAAIARTVGSPGAVRAVGTACRLNPLPIVIPCHRVVRSDGSLGQYAGGEDAKRTLLTAEGALGSPG